MNPIINAAKNIKPEDSLKGKYSQSIDLYSKRLIVQLAEIDEYDIAFQSQHCQKVCLSSALGLEICAKNCMKKFQNLNKLEKSERF